jgi:hypothetical protein
MKLRDGKILITAKEATKLARDEHRKIVSYRDGFRAALRAVQALRLGMIEDALKHLYSSHAVLGRVHGLTRQQMKSAARSEEIAALLSEMRGGSGQV